MLKKNNRLTKKNDFDNVFKNGRSSFNKIVGIKSVKNELEFSRFGIIVSTKISKKAVERNKIKRQIRAIIRGRLSKIKTSYDFAIITLPEIFGKSSGEIEKAIDNSLKRLGIS